MITDPMLRSHPARLTAALWEANQNPPQATEKSIGRLRLGATTRTLLHLSMLVGFAVMTDAVRAQTVVGVSNISATHANGVTYPSAPRLLGQSFTTDNSATAFNLTSVDLMFFQNVGTITDFTVTLRSNSGSNLPNTILSTFTGNASPTADFAGHQYSYVPGGSVVLAPNTTYWITWGYSNPTGAGAYFGSPAGDTASTGQWTLGANRVSFDAGVTWPTVAIASFPLQVSIQASAIPEPGTYAAIFGVAVLGFGVWRRRRSA